MKQETNSYIQSFYEWFHTISKYDILNQDIYVPYLGKMNEKPL